MDLITQNNASSSESSLLSLLSCDSPVSTNNQRLTPELPAAAILTAFINELIQLLIQTYMDTVKNKVHASISQALIEPKEQSFKVRFFELYFGK